MTNPQDIQDEVKLFYKKLQGTNDESLEGIDLRDIRSGPRLTQQYCEKLTQQVTYAEIDNALADIDDNKAPRLDGFDAVFF